MTDNRSEFEKTYSSINQTVFSALAGYGVGIGSNTAMFIFMDNVSIPVTLGISGALSAFAGIIVSKWCSIENYLYHNYEFDLVEKSLEE